MTTHRTLLIRRGHPLLRGGLSSQGTPARREIDALRLRAELAAQLCQLTQLRRQGLLTVAEYDAATARLLGKDQTHRRTRDEVTGPG